MPSLAPDWERAHGDPNITGRKCSACGAQIRTIPLDRNCERVPLDENGLPIRLVHNLTFEYPCLCDAGEPPYRHWILLVRLKRTAGWEPPEPPEPVPWPSPKHLGGNVKFDDGKPIEMPPPKPCVWCGRTSHAEIVERWEARSFREAIWGPGEHYAWDKPYKTPLKVVVIGYPCVCLEKPPYSHWILAVRLKKTPGWDVAAV